MVRVSTYPNRFGSQTSRRATGIASVGRSKRLLGGTRGARAEPPGWVEAHLGGGDTAGWVAWAPMIRAFGAADRRRGPAARRRLHCSGGPPLLHPRRPPLPRRPARV